MTRPAVLVFEPDAARRHELGHGLTQSGYEVVLASREEEALLFARGLGPAVIVAAAGLSDLNLLSALEEAPRQDRHGGPAAHQTLLLVGDGVVDDGTLPDTVVYLDAVDLDSEDLIQRVRMLLIGREIGVETDTHLGALVGDLAQNPLLGLVRELGRMKVDASIELDLGSISMQRGHVVDARSGAARGLKAFCRLARLSESRFWVVLREFNTARTIDLDLSTVLIAAVEDALGKFPDPRHEVHRVAGARPLDRGFTSGQQRILDLAENRITVAALLDELEANDGDIVQDLARLQDRGFIRLEAPRDPVRIVTDSTADLPPHLVERLGITVVPLTVHFGEQTFHDRVDLQPKDFYELLATHRVSPHSNPPPVTAFEQTYRSLAGDSEILSIHISELMSQTGVHARQAAQTAVAVASSTSEERAAKAARIQIVDSRMTTAALGMLVLYATRMAARGRRVAAIADRLDQIRERSHALFVVDTLEYLAKNGRIGRARALLGGLLGVKPILGLVDGEVAPIDRVRGRRAAHPRMVELFKERVEADKPVSVAIVHANAPMWADRLRTLIEQEFQTLEVLVMEMGPVVGTHTGPGCVGAYLYQPQDDEVELLAPLEV